MQPPKTKSRAILLTEFTLGRPNVRHEDESYGSRHLRSNKGWPGRRVPRHIHLHIFPLLPRASIKPSISNNLRWHQRLHKTPPELLTGGLANLQSTRKVRRNRRQPYRLSHREYLFPPYHCLIPSINSANSCSNTWLVLSASLRARVTRKACQGTFPSGIQGFLTHLDQPVCSPISIQSLRMQSANSVPPYSSRIPYISEPTYMSHPVYEDTSLSSPPAT